MVFRAVLVPGLVYKFKNQNIETFEDNFKFMGELAFFIYFDFETTYGKKTYDFKKDNVQYEVSYAIAIAFHPDLELETIFIVRGFNHSFEQFNDVGYLSNEMLRYFDPITTRQLRDCDRVVFEKKEKYSVSEMFSWELKFVIDILKKWLGKNFCRGSTRSIYLPSRNLRK